MSNTGRPFNLIFLVILSGGGCAGPALMDKPGVSDSPDAMAGDFGDIQSALPSARGAGGYVGKDALALERLLVDRGYARAEAREIRENLNDMDPRVRSMVTGMVMAMSQESANSSAQSTLPSGHEISATDAQTDLSADVGLLGQSPSLLDRPNSPAKHEVQGVTAATRPSTSAKRPSTSTEQVGVLAKHVVAETASEQGTAKSDGASAEQESTAATTNLEEVADGETESVGTDPEVPTPMEDGESADWRKQLRQTVARLRRNLRENPPDDADELSRLQMYLSLLHLVAEDQDEAMEVIQDFGDEELEFWRQTVMGLGVLLSPDELPRFRHRVDTATGHLRQGISSLAALGPLRLQNLVFCQKTDGFGDVEEFPSYVFEPGQPVLLYVEVENFGIRQKLPAQQDSRLSARRRSNMAAQVPMFETELDGSYEILDADQRPVVSRTLPIDRNQCRNRRRDYYNSYTIYMPDRIAAGHYTLELSIEDKIGQKFGSAAIDFQVK